MQFNQSALDNKIKHLDEIKNHKDYIDFVVSKNLGDKYNIEEVERRWVGGGATCYIISFDNRKAFLKIKHKDVTVESKLEEESSFSNDSCIYHEYKMLMKANEIGVSTPQVVFYEEYENFQFLATEYIDMSFEECIEESSIEEVLTAWNDLYNNVKLLFKNGIVHSDLHEYNIRFNNDKKVVLIDLEEARAFNQNTTFEESLDYTGRNSKSSLGDFPLCNEQAYSIHYNCLGRMKLVFKDYIAKKTIILAKECNYDSTNGICTSIDHGKSELIYQSISNDYFTITGQRTEKDIRPKIVIALLKEILKKEQFTYIDVGSNNGLFVREASKAFDGVIKCIGLEGFDRFNTLARALAFLEDCKNNYYYNFICGENDLLDLNLSNNCFFTIFSVWHHIIKKDVFLEQLKNANTNFILFEMAVQEECYNGHSWENEIDIIMSKLGFQDKVLLLQSVDYNRPIILISKEVLNINTKNRINKIVKKLTSISIDEKTRLIIARVKRYIKRLLFVR